MKTLNNFLTMLHAIIDRIIGLLHPVKVRRVVIYHPDYVEIRNVKIS